MPNSKVIPFFIHSYGEEAYPFFCLTRSIQDAISAFQILEIFIGMDIVNLFPLIEHEEETLATFIDFIIGKDLLEKKSSVIDKVEIEAAKNLIEFYQEKDKLINPKPHELLELVDKYRGNAIETFGKNSDDENAPFKAEKDVEHEFERLQQVIYTLLRDPSQILDFVQGKIINVKTTYIRISESKPLLPLVCFDTCLDLCLWCLSTILEYGLEIKKCQNCGKVFVPIKRSDEIYCDNIFEKGKTCKQIGYENKLNSNEFLKAYRTAYKTQHAKMLRNLKNKPGYKEEVFDVWVNEAKEKLHEAQSGALTLDEFKTWLNIKRKV